MEERQKIKVPMDNYGRLYIGLLETKLSPAAKLCYGVMWSFGSAESWASLGTIGRRMSMGRGTVRKAQAELEQAGWIGQIGETEEGCKRWEMRTPLELSAGETPFMPEPEETPRSNFAPPPVQKTDPKKEVKARKEIETYSGAFEAFWQSYPRHTGKAEAYREFQKQATKPETITAITEALTWQKNSETHLQREEKYTPHARTWLHNRRWEDEKPSQGQSRSSTEPSAGPGGFRRPGMPAM